MVYIYIRTNVYGLRTFKSCVGESVCIVHVRTPEGERDFYIIFFSFNFQQIIVKNQQQQCHYLLIETHVRERRRRHLKDGKNKYVQL